MRVVLLGPPGSGKGTQAARISSRYGIPAISTGRLLDAEIAAGSPLGRRAEEFVRAGELVPDGLVLDLVADRLFGPSAPAVLDHVPQTAAVAAAGAAGASASWRATDTLTAAPAADVCQGFLLDGFPRTLAQAEAFDARFATAGCALSVVLDLDVDESTVLARINQRAQSEDRLDDDEETARRRLKVFAERTAPLRAYYAAAGLLRTVDGSGTPDEVAARVETVLEAVARR
ncbi:nucleoside monophosphate kinase [Frankia sp. CNm7]|uniref:Adenylate kinase n=1 Tax=Frankia nepalensis TaxID=1836974 RepID=A0A937RJG5_9ACTN|nr:nucleoside monophosphate kinase [Frankia nepalensis]MBL7500572.1 nucleoside monophosphate kinase [Frankia nepalensis]MBL7509565.1 nucleoside monophosphate kinase [Frankia nepalensis]MBL7518168.1 nucleoside monophosphate kinase [Frankia nepalensis]MBL7633396.1 nucleoside monophosphate kinase [Frankia nepalensis]